MERTSALMGNWSSAAWRCRACEPWPKAPRPMIRLSTKNASDASFLNMLRLADDRSLRTTRLPGAIVQQPALARTRAEPFLDDRPRRDVYNRLELGEIDAVLIGRRFPLTKIGESALDRPHRSEEQCR